jgi:hypothetical protein
MLPGRGGRTGRVNVYHATSGTGARPGDRQGESLLWVKRVIDSS